MEGRGWRVEVVDTRTPNVVVWWWWWWWWCVCVGGGERGAGGGGRVGGGCGCVGVSEGEEREERRFGVRRGGHNLRVIRLRVSELTPARP